VSNDAPFLLDVTRLIWRRWKGRYPTGIDRVCLAYLRRFGPKAQAVVHHARFRRILGKDASQELFALLEGPPGRFRSGLPRRLLRHLGGLKADGQGRVYLNVGHTGLDSEGYRKWASRAAVKPVYLVHDLIPITHPEFCRAGEDERHRERMQTVLATATGVIGNSQATLDQLAEFAGEEGLTMPPHIRAPLGSDPLPLMRNAPTSAHPIFVTLGTIEARKNHMLLLDIWSRLIDRMGSDTPQLLIIGQRGWEADKVFDRLDRDNKLRGHVVELNRCSDYELARHLAGARAVLFPSFAEGYGLPLIEALGAGVPVVASDLTVFQEIGGKIPDYLRPADDIAWESSILDYAQPNSAARAAQLKRMAGFHAPDWPTHFQTVETWLKSLGSTA
jgi:glycosyltransferase involved in cell wall biosynthesis